MIYSKWLPDKGGYAYYESAERLGLGDDLPTPRLRQTSSIGVASTDIGRALPLGAKLVGYGATARGSITPLDRSGLGSLGSLGGTNLALLAAAAVASAVVGVFVVRAACR